VPVNGESDVDSPVTQRLRTAALSRQSTLYNWLLANYMSFSAILEKADGRVGWQSLADELAALGLTNERGEPPIARTTKATWDRVRKAVAARHPATTKRLRAKAPAPGIVQPAPPPVFDPRPAGATAPRPKHTFQLAKLRKYPEE
jgi:hypothetical protein